MELKYNYTHISKNLLIYFIFATSTLFVLLAVKNEKTIAFLYLFILLLSIKYIYFIKKIALFDIYSIVFVIYNLYISIPIINLFLFDSGMIFPKNFFFRDYDNIILAFYLKLSIISIICYTIICKKNIKKGACKINNFRIPFLFSIGMIFSGIILFFIFLYFTGAYKYLFINRNFLWQKIHTFFSLCQYMICLGAYYFFKGNKFNNCNFIIKITTIIILFSFIIFILLIGLRGQTFAIILVICAAFFRQKKIKLNRIFLYICILLLVYSFFVFATVYRGLTDKDFNKVFYVIKKNPLFLNPASIEYGTSYMNFGISFQNKFNLDYPLQTYVIQLKNFFLSYLSPSQKEKSILYRYRDIFFPERMERGGPSGGTGFCLLYESYINFGPYFFWILFVILGELFQFIDFKTNKIGRIYEIWYILLIPKVIQIGRSEAIFPFFITKYFHACIIYFLLIIILKSYKKELSMKYG